MALMRSMSRMILSMCGRMNLRWDSRQSHFGGNYNRKETERGYYNSLSDIGDSIKQEIRVKKTVQEGRLR